MKDSNALGNVGERTVTFIDGAPLPLICEVDIAEPLQVPHPPHRPQPDITTELARLWAELPWFPEEEFVPPGLSEMAPAHKPSILSQGPTHWKNSHNSPTQIHMSGELAFDNAAASDGTAEKGFTTILYSRENCKVNRGE